MSVRNKNVYTVQRDITRYDDVPVEVTFRQLFARSVTRAAAGLMLHDGKEATARHCVQTSPCQARKGGYLPSPHKRARAMMKRHNGCFPPLSLAACAKLCCQGSISIGWPFRWDFVIVPWRIYKGHSFKCCRGYYSHPLFQY